MGAEYVCDYAGVRIHDVPTSDCQGYGLQPHRRQHHERASLHRVS